MNDLEALKFLQKSYEDYSEEICSLLSKTLSEINDLTATVEKKSEWEENFKFASEKTLLTYTEYEKHSDHQKAFQLNRRLNTFAKKIQQLATQHSDSYLYMMGFFNATFNAYRNTMTHQNKTSIFTVEMSKMMGQKHVKEILEYLYDHDHTQNKTLCEVLSIKPNLLHKKIEHLVDTDCIIRYPAGKYTFYSLSDQGKYYVKNILGHKKSKIVDTEGVCYARYKPVRRSANYNLDTLYKEVPVTIPTVRPQTYDRTFSYYKQEVYYARTHESSGNDRSAKT